MNARDRGAAVRARCALSTLALLAGCARPPLVPDEPRAISGERLGPYQSLGECVSLRVGDRLDYLFSSSQSVKFDISYREGAATLAPIVRENSLGDSGIFVAALSTRFCLSWEAGPAGAIIDYRLRLKPATPG
jgi:hypothetical protein